MYKLDDFEKDILEGGEWKSKDNLPKRIKELQSYLSKEKSNYPMYHVYIVKCSDNTYYTGIAKDIQKRLEEHNHSPKGAKYTKAKKS